MPPSARTVCPVLYPASWEDPSPVSPAVSDVITESEVHQLSGGSGERSSVRIRRFCCSPLAICDLVLGALPRLHQDDVARILSVLHHVHPSTALAIPRRHQRVMQQDQRLLLVAPETQMHHRHDCHCGFPSPGDKAGFALKPHCSQLRSGSRLSLRSRRIYTKLGPLCVWHLANEIDDRRERRSKSLRASYQGAESSLSRTRNAMAFRSQSDRLSNRPFADQ
jgi:hypothetical protein